MSSSSPSLYFSAKSARNHLSLIRTLQDSAPARDLAIPTTLSEMKTLLDGALALYLAHTQQELMPPQIPPLGEIFNLICQMVGSPNKAVNNRMEEDYTTLCGHMISAGASFYPSSLQDAMHTLAALANIMISESVKQAATEQDPSLICHPPDTPISFSTRKTAFKKLSGLIPRDVLHALHMAIVEPSDPKKIFIVLDALPIKNLNARLEIEQYLSQLYPMATIAIQNPIFPDTKTSSSALSIQRDSTGMLREFTTPRALPADIDPIHLRAFAKSLSENPFHPEDQNPAGTLKAYTQLYQAALNNLERLKLQKKETQEELAQHSDSIVHLEAILAYHICLLNYYHALTYPGQANPIIPIQDEMTQRLYLGAAQEQKYPQLFTALETIIGGTVPQGSQHQAHSARTYIDCRSPKEPDAIYGYNLLRMLQGHFTGWQKRLAISQRQLTESREARGNPETSPTSEKENRHPAKATPRLGSPSIRRARGPNGEPGQGLEFRENL